MARFENVIIRDADRLDRMGTLGELLKTIGTPNQKIQVAEHPEEIPLVYQFCKGKRAGETIDVSPDKIIGGVSNIHIDEDGNLVGDVRISPMMRLSEHYQGAIDNLLVAKTLPVEEDEERTKNATPVYELKQLIVYDKMVVKSEQAQKTGSQMVQKTYAAPQEVYDVDPEAGTKLKTTLNQMNQEMQKVLDNSTWRGHKVE